MVSRDLRVHDHGGIVFDEFVGYWITMFLLPAEWPWILAGFAAFRLFDIWKPGPIRWCDRQHRGRLRHHVRRRRRRRGRLPSLHALRVVLAG